MSSRKFPEPGTPLYDKVVARVERGDDYKAIAADLGITATMWWVLLYQQVRGSK